MSRKRQIGAEVSDKKSFQNMIKKAKIEEGVRKFIDHSKELEAIKYLMLSIDFDLVSWNRDTNSKKYCELGKKCYELFKKTLFSEDENEKDNGTTNASLGGKKK